MQKWAYSMTTHRKNKRESLMPSPGKNWTTFCFENDIEHGHLLLFTNERSNALHNFNYAMQLFNEDGIALHIDPPHQCCHYKHRHGKRRTHYLKKIEHHTLTIHMLTIPRKFVRKHEV